MAGMHTRNAANGRSSGKLVARGEKVSGFMPTAEAAAAAAGAVSAGAMNRTARNGKKGFWRRRGGEGRGQPGRQSGSEMT